MVIAVEDILPVSEATLVLSESVGADQSLVKEESCELPIVLVAHEDDPSFAVTAGSEDKMAV